MHIDNVNQQTTFADVALRVLKFIGARLAKLSFLAEDEKTIELKVSQNGVVSKDGK